MQNPQEQRVFMILAIVESFRRIDMITGFLTEPLAPLRLDRFGQLIIKHIFQQLNERGLTSLPYLIGTKTAAANDAKRISDHFISTFGDR